MTNFKHYADLLKKSIKAPTVAQSRALISQALATGNGAGSVLTMLDGCDLERSKISARQFAQKLLTVGTTTAGFYGRYGAAGSRRFYASAVIEWPDLLAPNVRGFDSLEEAADVYDVLGTADHYKADDETIDAATDKILKDFYRPIVGYRSEEYRSEAEESASRAFSELLAVTIEDRLIECITDKLRRSLDAVGPSVISFDGDLYSTDRIDLFFTKKRIFDIADDLGDDRADVEHDPEQYAADVAEILTGPRLTVGFLDKIITGAWIDLSSPDIGNVNAIIESYINRGEEPAIRGQWPNLLKAMIKSGAPLSARVTRANELKVTL